jgi:hypothetical protein
MVIQRRKILQNLFLAPLRICAMDAISMSYVSEFFAPLLREGISHGQGQG